MSMTEISGYLGAFRVFLTFYMKTKVSLRIIGICSNCVFITYAYLGGLYPVLVLHVILLPWNGLRLREMLRLTREVRIATQGDLNLDWLKPFTSTRRAWRGSTSDSSMPCGARTRKPTSDSSSRDTLTPTRGRPRGR